MAYSKNLRTFLRVKEYLNELLDLKKDEERVWETNDGHKFAHFLREGLNYCKDNSAEVGIRFAELKDKVTISASGNKVTARFRFQLLIKPLGIHSLSYPEVTSINEIIMTVLKDKHLSEWRFPSLSLDNVDVKKLLKWATSVNKSALQSGDSIIIRNDNSESTTG